MKKTINLFTLMLFATLALGLGSCHNSAGDMDKKNAVESNDAKFNNTGEEDAKYVLNAYSDGMLEVKMAERAQDRATDQGVKDLAGSMVAAHTKMNAELEALAAKKNISLPHELTSAQQSQIDKVAEKSGHDFDVEYTEKLVSMHKDAISMFEKGTAEINDADIKNQFVVALPELRHHLDMATSVRDRIKQ